MLWVEPSAACNLSCDGCPTAAGRGGGVMSLDNFKRLLDNIPKSVKLLNLWHRGEPLAASDFPEMVALATDRGIRTQTHTNGTLLAKAGLAQRIVRSRLNRISIGVDGPDQETFIHYRTGGRLSDVEEGIRALVEQRQGAGSKFPKIFVECLVGRQSADQFRRVKEMTMNWGIDSIRFKTYRVPDLSPVEIVVKWLPDDPKLWRYKQNNGRLIPKKLYNICLRISWSALIAYNGDVLPCCFDAEGKFILGNIFEQPLGEIRTGEKFEQFRRVVMKRGDKKPAMCQNCTEGLRRLYLPERLVFG
ncbi:MAG: radical SAM/SPASM domain-containing protein [Candidatus Electryoneaceae bacterium]|nr:radical SAM/SPASM domain-containing protein [Candidatus Electryoneaceae bacterium]